MSWGLKLKTTLGINRWGTANKNIKEIFIGSFENYSKYYTKQINKFRILWAGKGNPHGNK